MWMPSLFRFLIGVTVLGALSFGMMYGLANLVDPQLSEITVRVPPNRFAE